MTVLGTLLKNRRCGDTEAAWNRTNLAGPESLSVTSQDFDDAAPIPREHVGKRIGGKNLSPRLSWGALPPETTALLLVVEDIDVPLSTPAVHCVALIEPGRLATPDQLPVGGLSARNPAVGVRILRSTIGRGYHGPEPIKGHGPHRYTFQLFALSGPLSSTVDDAKLDRTRPRVLLSAVTATVLARGRVTGSYER